MMKGRVRTLPLAAAALFVAAACSDTTTGINDGDVGDLEPGHALLAQGADVTLTAQADDFAPGAQVTLVLENGSQSRIGYNMCFHALEKRSGDSWAFAEEMEDRICTLILHILEAGESAQYPTSLPEGLPAGEYRFRIALHLMDAEEHRDQVSQSFQVGG
jgi:hypothetical protein